MLWVVFVFFKQKTAYEMRISDWSSDVCSSDLSAQHLRSEHHLGAAVALDQLPAQRLAEARRRLADLLQQEVRVCAAIDVTGGDLGVAQVVSGDGQLTAVVALAADAVDGARLGGIEDDDLAAAGGGVLEVGRQLGRAHV